MPTLSPLIAANEGAIYDFLGAIAWVAVGCVLLIAIVAVIRRRMLRDDEPADGFGLADLRRLHAEGQLSDEEYEQAKASMLARARAGFGLVEEGADEPAAPPAEPPTDGPTPENPGEDSDKTPPPSPADPR